MRTLVYSAEPAYLPELLGRARELGCDDPQVAWLGPAPDDAVKKELATYGAALIKVVESPALEGNPGDVVAAALAGLAESEPLLLLLISDLKGREVAPRAASLLGAGCVVEALKLTIEGDRVLADRYAYGGNTVAVERIVTPSSVVAVNPKTFEPEPAATPGAAEVEMVELDLTPSRIKIVESRPKGGESVNIEDAETLICVGRGIEKQEDLELVNELAGVLGGEVGCTRPLSHDFNWLSDERMVGISGKKCSPKLNIALGLSGEIQHSVGIMGSKLIVAINKDKSAPIFRLADYGVVGDLYEILPALVKELQG